MLRKRKCKEFLILVHTPWLLRLKLLLVTCEKATYRGISVYFAANSMLTRVYQCSGGGVVVYFILCVTSDL
jgi:hypothetical protein